MPTPVRPDLPLEAERAIDILGNRVRVAVLQSLLLDGPASRSELAQRLDLNASQLQTHMRRLLELEAVTQDPPGTESDHRKRTYRASKKEVDGLITALSAVFRRR